MFIKSGNDINYYTNYLQMSLATLVMNKEISKLAEGNQRLKAKINLMEKQMKTSDPVKKYKLHQQLDSLAKPSSLRKYYLIDPMPTHLLHPYQSDIQRYEQYKNSSADPTDSGFLSPDDLRCIELADHIEPGLIYSGTKYIGTTYTRHKEEEADMASEAKSEGGHSGGQSQGTFMSGRKRRYRRRANQVSSSCLICVD